MHGPVEATGRLSLLGGFRLTIGDRVVRIRGPKLRGLLAYLALSMPEPQPRSHLMTLLWGSRFEEQARLSLRHALSELRREMGDGVLVSDREAVMLSEGALECDALRFLALAEEGSKESLLAARHIAGEFLRGLLIEEEGFAEWLARTRERLANVQINCLQRLAQLELRSGEFNEAIEHLTAAIQLDEFREDSHGLLVSAFAAAGRRADALRHADAVAGMLKRELGVGLGPATLELVTRIRQTGVTEAGDWQDTPVSPHHQGADSPSRDEAGPAQEPSVGIAPHGPNQGLPPAGPETALAGRWLRWQYAVALIAALLAVPAAGTAWWLSGSSWTDGAATAVPVSVARSLPDSGRPSEAVLAAATPRILVFPLRTPETRQEDDELFAEGLTDDLISGLAAFPALQVMGRNTSEAFQATDVNPKELHASYGITHLVDGTLRKAEDRFQLRMEVIQADTGVTLWSKRYDEDVPGIFAARGAIVADIIGWVAAEVQRADARRSIREPPENLSAYLLTLKGRQLWQRPNREKLLAAQDLLRQAIASDPSYAPAYVYLAFSNLTAFNNKWSDDFGNTDALRRMVQYASKALEIDPDYGTALAALAIAYTYLGRHDEGETAARRALALNESDPDTLGRVAQVLSFAGQHQEAAGIIAKAIELDPFGPAQWFNFLSRAQFFSGEFDAAAVSARVCLERSDIQPCLETLAAALALAGKTAEAGHRWNQIVSSRPNAEPEQLVSRLRPAFKRQEDLDLLVRGLSKAKAISIH